MLLRAHLASCEGCRTVQARMAAQTNALRTAALEPVPRSVALPRRRRLHSRGLATATAVAAAAVVAFASLVAPSRFGGSIPRRALPLSALESRDVLLKESRLQAMQANRPNVGRHRVVGKRLALRGD